MNSSYLDLTNCTLEIGCQILAHGLNLACENPSSEWTELTIFQGTWLSWSPTPPQRSYWPATSTFCCPSRLWAPISRQTDGQSLEEIRDGNSRLPCRTVPLCQWVFWGHAAVATLEIATLKYWKCFLIYSQNLLWEILKDRENGTKLEMG